ncbi:MAG: hypothetical protein ACTHMI_01875 [Mucilaginibacter sp.]|jgi:hypothetical protein
MITPDDKIPVNDSDESEADDQQSQKDIHSNGLDDFAEDEIGEDNADPDKLRQAYDASEASYTLDFGDDDE